MKRVLRDWFPPGALGCFFCGVDSTPLLIFFIGLIGSLALGTLLTGVGLWMRGSFRDSEALRDEVFKAEQRL
jgi:hypothetical protein